jgi:phage gpG-like protein
MAVRSNVYEVIQRLRKTTSQYAPDSPQLKEAMIRIGNYVTALAKMNVRRQGLIDTGRLINSLRYEFFMQGNTAVTRIGSFNVPYAAVHEFGFRGTMNVPTHSRTVSQAFGRAIDPRQIAVRQHQRRVNIRPRPYLRPAFTKSRTFIIDTLRAAIQYSKG